MRQRDIRDFNSLEHVVSKELGLPRTKGSGNVHGDGDARGRAKGETYHQLLAECKFTSKEKRSSAITYADWDKTERAAYRFGRIPVMATADASGRVYVHLSLDDFARIYRVYLEHHDTGEEGSS